MTSLDGHGISVTVMRADDLMIRYLDAPATAPGWIPSFSVGEVREGKISGASK